MLEFLRGRDAAVLEDNHANLTKQYIEHLAENIPSPHVGEIDGGTSGDLPRAIVRKEVEAFVPAYMQLLRAMLVSTPLTAANVQPAVSVPQETITNEAMEGIMEERGASSTRLLRVELVAVARARKLESDRLVRVPAMWETSVLLLCGVLFAGVLYVECMTITLAITMVFRDYLAHYTMDLLAFDTESRAFFVVVFVCSMLVSAWTVKSFVLPADVTDEAATLTERKDSFVKALYKAWYVTTLARALFLPRICSRTLMGCGSLPFSLYADVRSSDDVIAFRRYDPNEAHWEMLRQIAPAGATQRYLRWKPPIDNDLSELKAKCSTILGLWTWRLARADMEESLKQGSIGQAQLQQLMWNLSEAQADVKVSHEATSVDAEYAAPSYDAYADVDCSTASKSKQKSKLKSKKRVKHRQSVSSKPTVVAKSRGGARKRATATAQANGADGVANEASKEARAEDDVVWYNSDVDGDDDDDIDGEVLETVGDATIHCLAHLPAHPARCTRNAALGSYVPLRMGRGTP